MEEILDFFNISKSFERKTVSESKPKPNIASTSNVGFCINSPALLLERKRKLEAEYKIKQSQANKVVVACEGEHSFGDSHASAEPELFKHNFVEECVISDSDSNEGQHIDRDRRASVEPEFLENVMPECITSDSDLIEGRQICGDNWASIELELSGNVHADMISVSDSNEDEDIYRDRDASIEPEFLENDMPECMTSDSDLSEGRQIYGDNHASIVLELSEKDVHADMISVSDSNEGEHIYRDRDASVEPEFLENAMAECMISDSDLNEEHHFGRSASTDPGFSENSMHEDMIWNFYSREDRLPEDAMQDEDDESEDETVYPYLSIYNGVYERYGFNLDRDKSLPIYNFKDKILETVRRHSVVILQGDTGCGKTTQVPQYLLDEAYRQNEYCKIICTQPRRIAAISVARRVCQERELDEGTVVGYQVGLRANMSHDTRLLYCTTGILLEKLVIKKTLSPYTHIILDEVHERDLDMDFLLIIIRRLLFTNSRNVKIILMSATIDTQVFSEYFKIRNRPAPVIMADSRRLFQVQEFYLCDLGSVNDQNAEVNALEPGISREMFSLALKLIIAICDIDIKTEEASVNAEAYNNKPSILIFLPGMAEIETMYKLVNDLDLIAQNNNKLLCLRLHSLISPDEQYKVFCVPPAGYRKVILATNIAESSITVPDIKYVIDFCLTKLSVTDTSTNLTALQLNWASKANCRQRAGRAGRVTNGRVYRLVPRTFYNNVLDEFTIPAMIRCPLEKIVLKTKLLNMGSPREVLRLAINPPNINQIQNTILTLKEVGALYKTVGDIYRPDDGDLSFVGRIMAQLPLDIKLTRLIVFGYVFGNLEDSIIMAAGLTVRSIFKEDIVNREEDEKAFLQKMIWANGTGSDLIVILRAYKEWLVRCKDEHLEILWAKINMIHLPSIREMHLLIADLKSRLPAFIPENNICKSSQCPSLQTDIVLKLIIAGAFYPNYFVYSKLRDPESEHRNIGEVYGRNLCRTVYFNNYNKSHIGQLYVRSIKDLFKVVNINSENIDIYFPPNSDRVLVMFQKDTGDRNINPPGSVCIDLYKALRLRYMNSSTSIDVMNPLSGRTYAKAHGLGEMEECVWVPSRHIANVMAVPSVFQKDISGVITYIKHCSEFYFQPLSQEDLIDEIHAMIINPFRRESCKFRDPSELDKGMIVCALFKNRHHRGVVKNIIQHSVNVTVCEIFFMDFGNTDVVHFEDLRCLPEDLKYLSKIPPTVFECRLAMIEPSALNSPCTEWTDEAIQYLRHHTNLDVIEIEVFSVVDGVVNVMNQTLNDILVEKGLARTSEESFKSKMDHDVRIQKQSVANRINAKEQYLQNKEYLFSIRSEIDVDINPPPIERCKSKIKLEGPFSPLETPLHSAVRRIAWQSAVIARRSVNFMNIDSDPKDMYERLIVATDVTEAKNGYAVEADCTTIMPNIHGFAALMTMLFGPTMQIKRNMTHTKYVTVLAGLGFDEQTGKPLYEEHDIVLNLDVRLSEEDISLINQIRIYMDALLYTDPNQEKPNIKPNELQELTITLNHLLFSLLSKQRQYIEIHEHYNDKKWEQTQNNSKSNVIYDKRCLFPAHKFMRLCQEDAGHIAALNSHCQELHNVHECERPMKPIKCRLCDQPIRSVTQLRIHLQSQLHRDREEQISFQPASS